MLATLPPDVRAGAEAARRASLERGFRAMELATVRLQVDDLNTRHADALAGEHLTVELMPTAAGKVTRLLWSAVSTDSEHEAAAMLAKARSLVANGEANGAPTPGLSVAEVLRRFLGAVP